MRVPGESPLGLPGKQGRLHFFHKGVCAWRVSFHCRGCIT